MATPLRVQNQSSWSRLRRDRDRDVHLLTFIPSDFPKAMQPMRFSRPSR